MSIDTATAHANAHTVEAFDKYVENLDTRRGSYGQVAIACGVGIAAGAYSVYAVAKQVALLTARTATFAAREAVKTHAPAAGIEIEGALKVADTSMQAAKHGNSAIDAARAQHAANKNELTAEQAAIVARSLDFGF